MISFFLDVLVFWLAAANLAGFALMGFDKLCARRDRRRVPERVLFLVALAGGSLGSWVGMYWFRNKTRHWYFVAGMPLPAGAGCVDCPQNRRAGAALLKYLKPDNKIPRGSARRQTCGGFFGCIRMGSISLEVVPVHPDLYCRALAYRCGLRSPTRQRQADRASLNSLRPGTAGDSPG